ncbi:unnamed protein product [Victoria cruziana]
MALSKSLLVFIALCLVILQAVDGRLGAEYHVDGGAGGGDGIGQSGVDCGAACTGRCSKASRQDRCIQVCNSCCMTCNCVPPGTFGNKDKCPCYASLTTHGGRPKCP